jgi:hypothetical protein
MMNEKSQISIFTILAVVLLMGAGTVLFISGDLPQQEGASPDQDIGAFVGSCLERTLRQGAFFISAQGGYYVAPFGSFSYGSVEIPYYHHHQRGPAVPTLPQVEEQLSSFVASEVSSCLDGFTALKGQGYAISEGEMKVEVVIAADDVSASMDYPLVITRGKDMVTLSHFSSQIPLNFQEKYDIAKDIIAKQEEEPNFSPLGYLSLSAYANGYLFEVANFNDSTVVYALIFNETEKFNDLFVYVFAAKYNWSNLLRSGSKVMMAPIGRLEAYVGYPFTYTIEATGDGLQFTDYTSLFDIDPTTGTFTFTPTHEQGGSHALFIKAEDKEGNSDSRFFELEVKGYSRPPVIEPINDLTIPIGQPFSYTVSASDEDNETVLLLDNSTLFDINPLSGAIQFTPQSVGRYPILITATDLRGLSDIEEFSITVQ